MLWTLTAEGREYADQSPVWQALAPGPDGSPVVMEGMDIVRATGLTVEQVKAHLDAGVKQNVVRQVQGQTTPPPSGPGFNLGSLEREAGQADAEMGKLISGMI